MAKPIRARAPVVYEDTAARGGACVEVGVGPQLVAVRDSKDPDGPKLAFSAGAWDTFIEHIKHGSPAGPDPATALPAPGAPFSRAVHAPVRPLPPPSGPARAAHSPLAKGA